MAKELQLGLYKIALAQISIQLVLSKQSQDNLQVLIMLSLILAEYDYVIQVHQNELTEDVSQHIVHNVLEGARCIGETKAQHPELIQSHGGCECSFGHVVRFQPNLVIC